ncbi:hypothetical protein NK6_8528 [Bradyrhizobium diazoefficiens]|uniref:Uncharacterized protein n=1 Tax=Bradyrhizobium diazoefficiens TaxID=1355477 RepID=A0A0E4BV19_9BRAD|nr:hypothetical protein NK6_8528 [Bradyrhizobium diazoefficiens]
MLGVLRVLGRTFRHRHSRAGRMSPYGLIAAAIWAGHG